MMAGGDFARSDVGGYFYSTLSGGIGAELSGGNFWEGAATGFAVHALNHQRGHGKQKGKEITIEATKICDSNDDVLNLTNNIPYNKNGMYSELTRTGSKIYLNDQATTLLNKRVANSLTTGGIAQSGYGLVPGLSVFGFADAANSGVKAITWTNIMYHYDNSGLIIENLSSPNALCIGPSSPIQWQYIYNQSNPDKPIGIINLW